MGDQEDAIQFSINEVNFHPVLKDIENVFWFYFLANDVLSNPEVQNATRARGSRAPYLLSMLEKYNKWVNLNIEVNRTNNTYTSKLDMRNSSIVIGKIMTIVMYDLLLSSKYYSIIKNQEEFRFLRHLRNGAAHDNKFSFKNKKGEWTIKENEIIKWQNKEISRELQDKIVFNDFVSFSEIFLLANYFSGKLKEIDKIN